MYSNYNKFQNRQNSFKKISRNDVLVIGKKMCSPLIRLVMKTLSISQRISIARSRETIMQSRLVFIVDIFVHKQ
jgi:hypothetical protein